MPIGLPRLPEHRAEGLATLFRTRRIAPGPDYDRKPKIENQPGPANFEQFIVATKSNAAPSPGKPEASFEDAMQRLETIVEAMEAGDVPLAELLAKYEEGTRLLAQCEQRLKAAELKIEQLKRQKDGSLDPAPFAVTDRSDLGLA